MAEQDVAADPQALLFAALAKAQGEFPPVTRDREVEVTMKAGGKYKFSYAQLSGAIAITRPVLAANGLAVVQLLTTAADGRPAIQTIVTHSGGGSLSGTIPIKTDGMNPQEVGSLVTYVRRYSYFSALGIAPEDDDGREAAKGHARVTAATTSRTADPAAPAKLVAEVEKLIAELNNNDILGEVEVRDGMQAAYGTQVTGELSKSQAENLRTRLASKVPVAA